MFDGAEYRSEEGAMPPSLRRAPIAAKAGVPSPGGDGRMNDEAPRMPAARYGDTHRPDIAAIIVTAAIHAIVLAAVLMIRAEAPQAKQDKRLTVVDLMASPPPPPPSPDVPPPSQPEIVAPRPPIQIARTPSVATTPDPQPQAPVAPVSAPAIAPGPPVVAAPAPPSTVQVSDLSVRMTSGSPPRYPMESRRKREQGTVLLSLTLGVDGRVANISVARSSGFDRLDQAALSAVRKWRWAPLIQDGRPVLMKGVVEIPFVLKNAD